MEICSLKNDQRSHLRKNQPQKIHKWLEVLKKTRRAFLNLSQEHLSQKTSCKTSDAPLLNFFPVHHFPWNILLDIVSLAPGRTNKWVSAIEGPKYLLYLKYCLTLDTTVSSPLFLRHFGWNCLKFGKRSPSFIIEKYFSFESCVVFLLFGLNASRS